ncbi:unnamed protein product [Gongylonema pulchrum]|uniref:Elongation factor Ts, mitochondrial n=1 Tax=Gongylonema pulchrum TaxID=637853 RepID=A0A183E352_9BILA|nr:unnamed protein product [Gongylonema pulchrum]
MIAASSRAVRFLALSQHITRFASSAAAASATSSATKEYPQTKGRFGRSSLTQQSLKVFFEALKELRKRTGYSYVNCRKALLEFGPDRLDAAIKWLQERAIKEGWEKAAKLGDRPTKHGLVSVLVRGSNAAIVEVNCETDFVARNESFKQLVEDVADAVLSSVGQIKTQDGAFSICDAEIADLRSTRNDKSVKDLISEAVGKLGENITISKAQLLAAQPDVQLFGYAHPRGFIPDYIGKGSGMTSMGRYASVIGLRRLSEGQFATKNLGEQLCQHIVGMRTKTLGTPPTTKEEVKIPVSEDKKLEEDELNAFCDDEVNIPVYAYESYISITPYCLFTLFEVTHIDENETQLLRQSFMLNPSQTVYEYVTGHGANIVDFYRVELGENCSAQGSK